MMMMSDFRKYPSPNPPPPPPDKRKETHFINWAAPQTAQLKIIQLPYFELMKLIFKSFQSILAHL